MSQVVDSNVRPGGEARRRAMQTLAEILLSLLLVRDSQTDSPTASGKVVRLEVDALGVPVFKA